MPTWSELNRYVTDLPPIDRIPWLVTALTESLEQISQLRGGRNTIFYASAFLQKPHVHSLTQISAEEINGLMSVMHGMSWDRLTLILHTPGGDVNAAETLGAYLLSKFPDIEVVIPTYSMSAGTMLSFTANRIIMGRQSQLGPIDPQIFFGGGTVSARGVVDEFNRAKSEILSDVNTAHVWAPILPAMGPSLLMEADNALKYGEGMVARWLAERMFAGRPNAEALGAAVASHFNDASTHKSHGRRIDRAEARSVGVVVEDLEDDQDLQDAVLTAYHVMSILLGISSLTKVFITDTGKHWVKMLSEGVVADEDTEPKQGEDLEPDSDSSPPTPSRPVPRRPASRHKKRKRRGR